MQLKKEEEEEEKGKRKRKKKRTSVKGLFGCGKNRTWTKV